ncbi:hypothetical protein DVA67_011645 [Solirubrobacter sp. CPCC 204708]|uniref:M10 family metallopeptidase domain-containing protein n=1 Tax=Solirubrobacter deserti TaxID=2282478 RepID=A0ABT4RPP7_9ACTN|nr:hypothetical protein [Solirubrobacter deserti]MBE2316633.1 hypothetical protein [Solirubrobacter deserti]MDA0140531.1 M10 family metallopeptidase domain-containing protein [Solirubrobacter deserti]
MRPVLASVGLALLAFPASASAVELNYEAPAASISRGAPLTFAVRTDAPESSVVVRVSGGNEIDEDGLLTGPEGTWLDEPATQALEDLQVWSVPNASILRQRPGRYHWQAYVSGDGADRPIGPVRQLTVTLPAVDRGRGKLYPKFGRKGSAGFLVSTANLPASVSKTRLKTLARTTAKRWNLKAGTTTKLLAGVEDGRSVAGFSADVPSGTLGVQTDYLRNGRVVERDLALHAAENWAAGPNYPALDEIDLESVLLHEFGHMAGNKQHESRCVNSPLDEVLGAGEWWRGARDHWFGDCTAAVSAASALRAKAFAHRVVRVD